MTQFKKFAKYGSAVVASFAVAVTLLITGPAGVAHAAAPTTMTVTPSSLVAGAVTTYTVTYADPDASATTQTITVDFTGTGATAQIQALVGAAATLSSGFTGCTVGSTTIGGDGNAVIVTLSESTAGACAAGALAGTRTLTITNIRNPIASTQASAATVTKAVINAGALASTNSVTFTAINATFSAGIGVGAVVSAVSVNAGSVYVNVYPAAAGAAVTVSATQGVFNSSNSTTITCVDGTATCDADGASNGVVSLLYIGGGAGGTQTFTISASALSTTRTLTMQGNVSTISIAPTSSTMSSVAGTTNSIPVTVKDSNGANVADGTVVTLTTNLGTLAAPSQSTTATTASGIATFTLTAQGASGTATLTATVGTVTQTATVVLSGTTETITVKEEFDLDGTGAGTAFGTGGAPNNAQVALAAGNTRISAALKDAGGSVVGGVTPTISTTASGVTFGACTSSSTVTGISTCPITALPTATASLGSTVDYTVTVGTKTGSGSFIIGGTVATTNKLTIDAADAAVASAQTVKVTVTTSTDLRVADGAAVTLVASGGAIVTNTAVTRNGEVTFTFVAPGTPQVVGLTAVMTVSGVNVTASKSINVTAAGTVTPPPATLPTGTGFSGGTIAPAGVSIVSFTGTTAQLATAGAAAKAVSVTATVGGKMVTYVVGAPDFVNAEWNAAFTGSYTTLVIIKTGS